MKRNKVLGNGAIIVVLCSMLACAKPDGHYKNNQYFQYYVSTIRIKEPRVVIFEKEDMDWGLRPTCALVCPDSAVCHCTEPDWIDREDIFLLNTSSYYTENEEGFNAYGSWFYKLKPWDKGYYLSFDLKPYNDTIKVGRFYFDDDLTFTLSLHTTSFYYDNTKRPKNEPMSEKWDVLDTTIYSNTYRLAVSPRYSIWQTYKINKLRKEMKVYYETIELPDTTLFLPVDCVKNEN